MAVFLFLFFKEVSNLNGCKESLSHRRLQMHQHRSCLIPGTGHSSAERDLSVRCTHLYQLRVPPLAKVERKRGCTDAGERWQLLQGQAWQREEAARRDGDGREWKVGGRRRGIEAIVGAE